MAQTERQAVVEHFAKKENEYAKPVELALDLRAEQVQRRELPNGEDYIKKVLDAGYKSPIFTDLHKDVTEAKKAAPKKTANKDETK